MKTCFRCNKEKPLEDFYKHPRMGDGHLGKCKDCAKSDTASRYREILLDPVRNELEHDRQREKMRRQRASGAVPISKLSKYEAHKRQVLKHPIAVKARAAVLRAVRSGKLLRQPCEKCGAPNSQGHHDDHSKPLEVRWLCPRHHAEADNELRCMKRISELATL